MGWSEVWGGQIRVDKVLGNILGMGIDVPAAASWLCLSSALGGHSLPIVVGTQSDTVKSSESSKSSLL